MKNKLILPLILVLFLFSCERRNDFENENIAFNYLFNVYADEFEIDVLSMNEIIITKKSLLAPSENDTLKKIDSLIDSYYNYLDDVDLKSDRLSKNIFYEKDRLQKEGKIFRETSEVFFKKLHSLITNKQIKKYFYGNFNLDYIKDKDGLHFPYMEYYYLDIPYSTFKFLIKKRKYELRMLQNEILNSYLISNNYKESPHLVE